MSDRDHLAESRAHNAHTPFSDLVGIDVVASEPGRSTLRMVAQRKHMQAHGYVQGGILVVLADAAFYYAVRPTLREGEDTATVELKINYLSGAREGEALIAECRLVQRGGRIAVGDMDVYEETTRRPVLKGLGTYIVSSRRAGKADGPTTSPKGEGSPPGR